MGVLPEISGLYFGVISILIFSAKEAKSNAGIEFAKNVKIEHPTFDFASIKYAGK